MPDYRWIHEYATPYSVTDSDCDIIGEVLECIRTDVYQKVIQTRRQTWEFSPPYSVWVAEDDYGWRVQGRRNESKDQILEKYYHLVIRSLFRRLFLLRDVRRVAWQIVAFHGADLRTGKSKPIFVGTDDHTKHCVFCGHWHQSVFDCGDVLFCGDCRYLLRHGHEPRHPAATSAKAPQPLEDEVRFTTHTIERWRPTVIHSYTHYRVLMEIEREEMMQARDADDDNYGGKNQ